MYKIVKIFRFILLNRSILLHIPRSIYYNIKLLDFKIALRCPIFIHNSVKVNIGKNARIVINQNIHSGMVKLGFNTTNFYDPAFDKSVFTILGEWNINGSVTIGPKSRISIGKNVLLKTWNLWITGGILLIVRKKIQLGNNSVLSWNITMMDHDAHGIFDNDGNRTNIEKDIIIGDRVWIGCNSMILKGTHLSNDIVVGANSLVCKKVKESNIVLAGSPVEIKKHNVSWGGFY